MHGVMMPVAMFEQIMARWEDGLEGDLGAGGPPLAGRPRAQVEAPTASNTMRLPVNLTDLTVPPRVFPVSGGRGER